MTQAIEYRPMFLVTISETFLERTKPASSMVKPAAIHITRAPENKRYMVFKANSISLIAFL